MRALLVLTMALHLGCAGAVWSDAKGNAFVPLAWGNAEFASDHLCLAGGPISDGAVQGIVELVRVGLSLLLPGLSQQAPNASQDTPREAGCFETDPVTSTPEGGLTVEQFRLCYEAALRGDGTPIGDADGISCANADLDSSGTLTLTDFALFLESQGG